MQMLVTSETHKNRIHATLSEVIKHLDLHNLKSSHHHQVS